MTVPPGPNDPSQQYPPPGGGQPPPPGQPYGAYPPAPGSQPGGYPPAPGYGQPPAPPGRYFDQQSGLYLPDGTALASTGRRIGAYFLSILLFIVTLGIGFIIWGLILWGKGTSPALSVLGMKCYRVDDGTVPGFGRMALRDIVGRIIDGIVGIITELVSFIMMLTGNKRQSLHDLVSGTVVLYDPNKVLG